MNLDEKIPNQMLANPKIQRKEIFKKWALFQIQKAGSIVTIGQCNLLCQQAKGKKMQYFVVLAYTKKTDKIQYPFIIKNSSQE